MSTSDERSLSEAAFTAFWQWHRPQVLSFFRSKGCGPEAEDLCQDVAARAFRFRSTYRREASLRTWFDRIADNTFKNWLRGRKTQKREGVEVDLDLEWLEGPGWEGDWTSGGWDDRSPLGNTLRRERQARLEAEVRQLPPNLRRVAHYRLFTPYKISTIATMVGIPEGTVKSRWFEANQILKRRLAGDGEPRLPRDGRNDRR